MYINDTPITPGVHLPPFADVLVCMPQIAKGVIFSESCNAVSIQLKHVESAGKLKPMKVKLKPSTSLIDLDQLKFISH
jgi:hypothetical protein